MNPSLSLAPSGNLLLEIPSVLAEGRSQFVEVPLSIGGLSILKKILKARQEDPRPSLGRASMPTASDIHRFMENEERERRITVAKQIEAKYGEIELEL